MRERTLLERLGDPRSDRPGSHGLNALADSIQRHLERMLNSRQGSSSALQDYGMPDLTEAVRNCPEAIGEIEEAIRQSIERYESRLGDVSVRMVEDEDHILALSFEIRARLVTSEQDAGILLNTRVDQSGRVSIQL